MRRVRSAIRRFTARRQIARRDATRRYCRFCARPIISIIQMRRIDIMSCTFVAFSRNDGREESGRRRLKLQEESERGAISVSPKSRVCSIRFYHRSIVHALCFDTVFNESTTASSKILGDETSVKNNSFVNQRSGERLNDMLHIQYLICSIFATVRALVILRDCVK